MAEKKTLSELASPFKVYPQVLINVRVKDKPSARNDADVIAATQKAAETLGDSGRILMRESGTEPVIRVMVEAPDKELCQSLAQSVVDVIKAKGHAI